MPEPFPRGVPGRIEHMVTVRQVSTDHWAVWRDVRGVTRELVPAKPLSAVAGG